MDRMFWGPGRRVTLGTLAQALDTPRPQVARAVAHLENEGLVGVDARARVVGLTRQGLEELRRGFRREAAPPAAS